MYHVYYLKYKTPLWGSGSQENRKKERNLPTEILLRINSEFLGAGVGGGEFKFLGGWVGDAGFKFLGGGVCAGGGELNFLGGGVGGNSSLCLGAGLGIPDPKNENKHDWDKFNITRVKVFTSSFLLPLSLLGVWTAVAGLCLFLGSGTGNTSERGMGIGGVFSVKCLTDVEVSSKIE